MRFPIASLVLIISAFSVSSTFARMNHASARTHDHPSIARRQHQQLPRLLNDICVQIEASVVAQAIGDLLAVQNLLGSGLGLGLDLDVFAKADICLCLSAVPLFVHTDIRIQALVDLVDEGQIEAMLTALVRLIVCLQVSSAHRRFPIDQHLRKIKGVQIPSTRCV